MRPLGLRRQARSRPENAFARRDDVDQLLRRSLRRLDGQVGDRLGFLDIGLKAAPDRAKDLLDRQFPPASRPV